MSGPTLDKNDGGPAFPSNFTLPENQGLTLRDYFAAAALQTALAKALHNFSIDGVQETIDWEHIVGSAYDAAELMLKERVK
mgnify:CR=1 FL=1|tara:strand:+ start:219 stop:461 length:243 start_codon:yes stop_codon:yes gene_type:complete